MASPPASSELATTAGAGWSLQIQSPDDLQRLARMFSASGLFGRAAGNNPDAHMAECAIKILAGLEAGFGSFASISGISVINGKPGYGANLLAQAIKRHPSYDYRVLEKTDQVCKIRFMAGRETLGEEVFTIAMAERAGLVGKAGPWRQYPEAMLFARCLSAGMRTHCPDALGGAPAYTPEELGAQGQIDENGVVITDVTQAARTLTTTEELTAGALRACEARGLTPAGLLAMVQDISGGEATELSQLQHHHLRRMATSGITRESAERWNAAGEALTEPAEDPEDLPATWTDAEPVTA